MPQRHLLLRYNILFGTFPACISWVYCPRDSYGKDAFIGCGRQLISALFYSISFHFTGFGIPLAFG